MQYKDTELPSFPRTELEAIGLGSRGFLPPLRPLGSDSFKEEFDAAPPGRGQTVLRWAVIALLFGLIGLALIAPGPYGGYTPAQVQFTE
jgi:hypothetical protein